MISFKWMQFSSINFIDSNFIHDNKRTINFHNHILKKEINSINHYSKEMLNVLKKIDSFNFDKINLEIEKIPNADVLETNSDLEITLKIMNKYGYSNRYITQKMFGGENWKQYEYFSKKEYTETVKPAYMINPDSRILLKCPLRKINENKVRLIILVIKTKKSKIVYPLYLDIHHYAYSSKNFKEIPNKKDIFEIEFRKRVFSYKKIKTSWN